MEQKHNFGGLARVRGRDNVVEGEVLSMESEGVERWGN